VKERVVAETADSVAASPEDREDEESVTELLERLGRQISALVYYEARLEASRKKPELRQAARNVAVGLGATLGFLTAFALANASAVLGLSTVMSSWLAALLLAAAWSAVGALLALALRARARRASRRRVKPLQESRDAAEQAVRITLDRLAPAITNEVGLVAVPIASGLAGEVIDSGDDLIEGADEFVESITEELPGGGVVNQMWDVVLMPGRFGVRLATTVLKRSEPT
jgi:Putative Actinobacterial Holin-X, holin superfamily III